MREAKINPNKCDRNTSVDHFLVIHQNIFGSKKSN